MDKLYLAVNFDGTEVCSDCMLSRYSDYIKSWNDIDRHKGIKDSELFDESDNKYKYWTNESSNYNTEIYDGLEAYNTVIYLPKGTIKLITGTTLTWDDMPIEVTDLAEHDKLVNIKRKISEKLIKEYGKSNHSTDILIELITNRVINEIYSYTFKEE